MKWVYNPLYIYKTPYEILPFELWLIIFSYFSLWELLQVKSVCKSFYQISNNRSILKNVDITDCLFNNENFVLEQLLESDNLDAYFVMVCFSFFNENYQKTWELLDRYFRLSGKLMGICDLNIIFLGAYAICINTQEVKFIGYIHKSGCTHLRLLFLENIKYPEIIRKCIKKLANVYTLDLMKSYDIVSNYCGSDRINKKNEVSIDYNFVELTKIRENTPEHPFSFFLQLAYPSYLHQPEL